jgi:hypothetical protein
MATNYWKELISEDEAKIILGSDNFVHAISRGTAHCSLRRTDAWRLGNAKEFAAFDCATRIAEQHRQRREGSGE